MPSLKQRFFAKVRKTTGCWLWTASLYENGYGQFDGKRAHRVSWELAHGPIPRGLKVLHRCDVKNCVRPSHLFLGTLSDNMQDALKKGRLNPPKGSRNGMAKLDESVIRRVLRAYARGKTQTEIAYEFNLSLGRTSLIVRRKIWRHVNA